jgi:gluconate 2-dehydrogenase gamma chain
MKRRDSLKAISLSGFGMAALPTSDLVAAPTPKPYVPTPGRTPNEVISDKKIFLSESFFTADEMKTITILSDIIIPADSKSGSATQAGVPAFIDFIVKDKPELQTPLRGGLRWLNSECLKRFNRIFNDCSYTERIAVIDDIAYPEDVKPGMSHGVSFFNTIRGLVVTGFYTTKMGFDDLGYMGNTPNEWNGVPQDVLDKYGFKYEAFYDAKE